MARARTSIPDMNFSTSNDRQNGYASGHSRLLSNDDQTYRGSLEYKEPFQDEEPANGPWTTKLPLYNNERTVSYYHKNKRWIIPTACIFALVCLISLFRPYSGISTWSSQPSTDLSVSGFSGPRNTVTFTNGTQWVKPVETKIVGIIFCEYTFPTTIESSEPCINPPPRWTATVRKYPRMLSQTEP